MQNQYFNPDEFNRIMSYREKDAFGTIEKLERYINKYPKDYSAITYYCSELIRIGNLDKAEEICKMVEEKIEKMGNEKYYEVYLRFLFAKLKLLSYTGKYKECLELGKYECERLHNNGMCINRLIVYCEKQLGILKLVRRPEGVQPYSYNQIIEYKEEDFYNHIKKHLYENMNQEDFTEGCYFCKDFPLDKVMKIIKERTPNNERINNGLIDNNYYYKFNGCGVVDGKSVDYFVIITLNNTDEFITMYPVDCGPRVPYYNLNYLLAEENDKVLKKSRVAAFNKKYGLNIDNN